MELEIGLLGGMKKVKIFRLCRQEKNSTGGAVDGTSADLERRVRACAAAGFVGMNHRVVTSPPCFFFFFFGGGRMEGMEI